MARTSRPSLFERKLQELERQQDVIQNDIRSLSKSMRKIEEGGELPPLRSRALDIRPARTAPPPAAEAAAPARSLPPSDPVELIEEEAPEVEPAPAAPPPPLVVDARRRASTKNPRFANYFASGSFGSSRPLAEERRIQRNKAVFMIIVLVVVLAIVWRFVF